MTPEASRVSYANISSENDGGCHGWLAGESQDIADGELHYLEDNLLCNEVLDSSALISNNQVNQIPFPLSGSNAYHEIANDNVPCGIADLENLDLDTPPDFHLAVSSPPTFQISNAFLWSITQTCYCLQDLQFGSQESIFDWIDRI